MGYYTGRVVYALYTLMMGLWRERDHKMQVIIGNGQQEDMLYTRKR